MDASGSTWTIVLLAALLLLSGLLIAFETALFSANRLRLRHLAGEGDRRAAAALRLLDDPGRVLTAVLLTSTALRVAAVVLAAGAVAGRLGSGGPAFWATTVAMIVLVLIVGEIAPKTVAARRADRLALVGARPAVWLTRLLSPVIFVLSQTSNVLVRPFGGRVNLASPLATEVELRLLVAMGEEEGVIEHDEREMIRSIFEFGDTVAREVMVPRMDMVCLDETATLDEIAAAIIEHGHSRIPVYRDTIDRIVGVVHAKDLLRRFREGSREGTAAEIARPAMFVPETKKVDGLFREMRRSKTHMAIVVDEYGGTAGLVTIEDLVEEIVGEIQDEYDAEEPMVKILDETTAVVDGRTNIEEVNDRLGLDFPVGEVDTIGGFVYQLLGRVPKQGEVVSHNGVELNVERTDGQRITRVRIHKQPSETAPAGAP